MSTVQENTSLLDYISTINAKQYGAKGDGITDDSQALQNAIDFCSNNKFKLFLNNGIYLCKNIKLKSNLEIEGNNSTLKLISNALYDNISHWDGIIVETSGGIENIIIKNLNFDGSISNYTCQSDSPHVVRIISTNKNINFENCSFKNSYRGSIDLYDCENIKVKNCCFTNVDCGVICMNNYACNVYIHDCTFDGHSSSEPVSLHLNDAAGNVCENIYITNNVMKNKTSGSGILVGKSENDMLTVYRNIHIQNNKILDCASGITVNIGQNMFISNNTIQSTFRSIFLGKNTEKITVNNNRIVGIDVDSTKGINSSSGLLCYGNFCKIINNTFENLMANNANQLGFRGYAKQTTNITTSPLVISGNYNIVLNNDNIITNNDDRYAFYSIIIGGSGNTVEIGRTYRDTTITDYMEQSRWRIVLGVYIYSSSTVALTKTFLNTTNSTNNEIINKCIIKPYIINVFNDADTNGIGSNKIFDILTTQSLASNLVMPGGVYSK